MADEQTSFGYGSGMKPECIIKYFDDPMEITACSAEGVAGVCAFNCGVYRNRRIAGLRGTDVPDGRR